MSHFCNLVLHPTIIHNVGNARAYREITEKWAKVQVCVNYRDQSRNTERKVNFSFFFFLSFKSAFIKEIYAQEPRGAKNRTSSQVNINISPFFILFKIQIKIQMRRNIINKETNTQIISGSFLLFAYMTSFFVQPGSVHPCLFFNRFQTNWGV